MKRWRHAPRYAAVVGLAWLLFGVSRGEWLAHVLVGFAVLAIVPLGVSLTQPEKGAPSFTYRMFACMLPTYALGGLLLFAGDTGTLPVVLACGAVGVGCVTIAWVGVGRAWRRGKHVLGPELAVDVACWSLPVGALWLFASRIAYPLFGYQEPVRLLTAAHFFTAGFGAPLMLGVLGRHLPATPWLRRVHGLALVAVVAGVALTAVGILLRDHEGPLATVLATGIVLGALCLVATAWDQRRAHPLTALALAASAAAGLAAVALALSWAFSGSGADPLQGSRFMELDAMIRYHGSLASLGFVGLGLAAMTSLEHHARR